MVLLAAAGQLKAGSRRAVGIQPCLAEPCPMLLRGPGSLGSAGGMVAISPTMLSHWGLPGPKQSQREPWVTGGQ